MKKLALILGCGMVLAAVLDRAAGQTPKPVFFSSNVLPPPNGMYISPAQWHALYANGVIMSNVVHRAFTENPLPPPMGASGTHAFTSQLDFDLSLDNGGTFSHVTAPATVAVNVQATGSAGGQQVYTTEMLQLNLSSATLPAGLRLRASTGLPSMGQTTIGAVPGGYLIGSFFDIYLELSLDNGQTWSASTQAGHVELRVDPTLIPPVPEPSGQLPPPEDVYASLPQFGAAYAAGVVIKDVRHKFFTQSMDLLAAPVGTNKVAEQFESTVDFQLSLDGGQTFNPVRTPAMVSVTWQRVASGPPLVFDAEMTQLDITIAGLPTVLKIRESPALPSYGETAVSQMADGSVRISSFFDIFTELSLDGGQNWQPPTNGPAHVELQGPAMLITALTPNLPPTNGQFNLPGTIEDLGGRFLSNVVVHNLSPSLPLPPPGQSQFQEFTSTVDLMVSTNSGRTFMTASASGTGLMVISNTSPVGANSPAQYLNTELQQFTISGGTLPPGLMIRESPSKASLGRTVVSRDAVSGGYRISSFFDVFTEMSLDNGQTWHLGVNDPATFHQVPFLPYAPYVITCPPDITVFNGSSAGAVVNYSLPPFVIPDCPICCFAATCIPPSGSVFPLGTTTVHCTGHDGCGEHPTCSFNITVLQSFIFNGLFSSALGRAVLMLNTNDVGTNQFSGTLVLSNLTSSGQDGFHLELGAVDSLLLTFQPFPTTYNTCIVAQATGPYALDPNHVLGVGTYWGGTNPMIRADFSALGASSVMLEVRDGNNHSLSSSHLSNASWVDVNHLFPPPCTNTTTVYSYSQSPDHICYRFCKFGCDCTGTNCYIERVACFRPDIAVLPIGLRMMGLDLLSQGVTVPSSLTIQSQEIGMFGVKYQAKGQATLEAHPGLLLVNDIGATGQDGVAVNLNNASQLDLTLAPTRLMSPGACWRMTAFGRLNGAINVELGAASLTPSVSPGGGSDVRVDFDPIGATKTRVDVYQGSQLVGTTTLSTAALGTLHPSGNLVGCGKLPAPFPCFWLRFDSPFVFSAADGNQFSGDQIRLLAANPTVRVQSLSQFCLQACQVGQLAILGAALPPTISGILKRTDGRFEIDGQGLAGVNYRLESTPTLGSPLQWTPVSSAMSDPDGSFQLLDTRTGNSAQQFYHVVSP